MAKISAQLLRSEYSAWKELDKSITSADGKNVDFGLYMNNKYMFNNKLLAEEPDPAKAMLMLLKDHVQEFK